jgi:hypothetical protein
MLNTPQDYLKQFLKTPDDPDLGQFSSDQPMSYGTQFLFLRDIDYD